MRLTGITKMLNQERGSNEGFTSDRFSLRMFLSISTFERARSLSEIRFLKFAFLLSAVL